MSAPAATVTGMATTTSSPGLSSFWRDLPREGRLMLSIVAIQFLGTGLVLPFHVVYLHEVRGFPLSDVGLLLGLPPLMQGLRAGSSSRSPSKSCPWSTSP